MFSNSLFYLISMSLHLAHITFPVNDGNNLLVIIQTPSLSCITNVLQRDYPNVKNLPWFCNLKVKFQILHILPPEPPCLSIYRTFMSYWISCSSLNMLCSFKHHVSDYCDHLSRMYFPSLPYYWFITLPS